MIQTTWQMLHLQILSIPLGFNKGIWVGGGANIQQLVTIKTE